MTATLPPIELRTLAVGTILSDEVYTRIGAAILDGTLAPGTRLRDVDLAAQLGVSRTPVREALQRLERFGLVEIAVGRYTRVSAPDDALREDTGVFTAYFMGNALRIALSRCGDDELIGLVAAADEVIAAAASGERMPQFDASVELYTAVTRATANQVFIGIIREASLAIRRNLRGWDPFVSVPRERFASYTDLRDAIAARDADGAERAVRVLHGLI